MQPDPDFEHIPQPEGPASDTEEHRNDYGHEENGHHHDEYDDNLGAKGEFLDTWVSCLSFFSSVLGNATLKLLRPSIFFLYQRFSR